MCGLYLSASYRIVFVGGLLLVRLHLRSVRSSVFDVFKKELGGIVAWLCVLLVYQEAKWLNVKVMETDDTSDSDLSVRYKRQSPVRPFCPDPAWFLVGSGFGVEDAE